MRGALSSRRENCARTQGNGRQTFSEMWIWTKEKALSRPPLPVHTEEQMIRAVLPKGNMVAMGGSIKRYVDCSPKPQDSKEPRCYERALRLTQTGGERKGRLITEGEVDPGRRATRGTEKPPQTMAPASPLVCPPPPALLAAPAQGLPQGATQPGWAKAAVPRQRPDAAGRPPILRCAPQWSGEPEATVPPLLPMSGHVTNLHARSLSGAIGDRRGEAGQGLAGGRVKDRQGRCLSLGD